MSFRTELHNYQVDGQIRFANATEVSVPAALSGMVLGVRGLDNFRPRPRARVARPNFTSHQTGNHFLSPGDFATIYNVKPLYQAGLDGTGETIAVVGQTQIDVSDVDAFRSRSRFASDQSATGFGGRHPPDSLPEMKLRPISTWNGPVESPGMRRFSTFTSAAIRSQQNVFDSMEYAIDNNLAPVISTSYGNCEANLGTVYRGAAVGCAAGQQPGPDHYSGCGRCRRCRLRDVRRPPRPPTGWRLILLPASPRLLRWVAVSSPETQPVPSAETTRAPTRRTGAPLPAESTTSVQP